MCGSEGIDHVKASPRKARSLLTKGIQQREGVREGMNEQRKSDRELLEMAEARELLRHKAAGGSDEYIKARSLVVDQLYGKGSRERIRENMKHIRANNE